MQIVVPGSKKEGPRQHPLTTRWAQVGSAGQPSGGNRNEQVPTGQSLQDRASRQKTAAGQPAGDEIPFSPAPP